MNEICEKALEYYIKKLEKDNKKLKAFANSVKIIIAFDFDGANPNKSDKDIVDDIRNFVRMYESIFKED